jgi:uncharacterized protein (TIGR03435 family)
MTNRTGWIAGFALLAAAPWAIAQTATPPPAFEVASVKAHDANPGAVLHNFTVDHGNLTVQEFSLTFVIAWAYDVDDYRQLVVPDWVRLTTVNIFAKAGSPVPDGQVRLMLQTLLADRFKLKVHVENRQVATYALVVGKDGPKLKPSASEGPMDWHRDYVKLRETVTGATMPEVAKFLGQYINRLPDRTGLTGRYDFVLEYAGMIDPTDEHPSRAMIQARPEALKQVGLKLEVTKLPMDVVIVDHLEKVPTEN